MTGAATYVPAPVSPSPATNDRGRTPDDAPQGRYDAIDVARGLAVLAMIGVHLVGTDGGTTPLERGLTGALATIEPTVAALFCVVAGISWTIQSERVGVTPRFRRYLLGRALALGVFGVLFHVLFWSSEILVPFAMMMALSVVVLGPGPRVAGTAALLFVAVTPVVTRLLGSYAATDWLENGLHVADREFGGVTLRYLLFDGNYPLVSWMAFPLAGMVFWQTARQRSRLRGWCLVSLGAAVLGHAVAARAAPNVAGIDGAERYLAGGWTPSSALFLLTTGSASLAIVGALLWRWGTAPMPHAMRPAVLFGRASLSHYVLHIVVAYSALRMWYPGENWPVMVGFWTMVAYLAVGIPLSVVWFRNHTHGPLEMLWARTSRRPAPLSRTEDARTPAGVEVRRTDGDAGLFARRSFAPGEIVLRLEGRIVARPTRHTIQLGPGEHLEPSSPTACPWVYLNHSCAPNVVVDVAHRVVIARQPIAAGDELRFDYDTTEWEVAEPFVCRCGAPDCVGTVRGFRHQPADRQQALMMTVDLAAALRSGCTAPDLHSAASTPEERTRST